MAGLAVACSLLLAGCTGGTSEPPAGPSPSADAKPARLLFGVWGEPDEISAYQAMVDTYNATAEDSQVELRSWTNRQALADALRAGGRIPDVFLASRRDLAWLLEEGITRPVDELLDERGTDFGDGYSRDALRAFSTESRLQCMPYGISPMVLYYNTDLVDFDRMRARELPAPDDEEDRRWTFEEFAAAVDFATRPRRGTRGVHVEPTLQGLAPFVESGGGDVFDDDTTPTSTAFSSEESREALTRTLELLRNPQVTLTEDRLRRATPLEWFKQGRLAILPGFRSSVPELRHVPGLRFDVMPMPTLSTAATVGEISGLCLSARSESIPEAADFLVHATSTESVERVARSGYLMPANLEVALSEAFLQPGRAPAHAAVYTDSLRALYLPPILDDWDALTAAVEDEIRSLVTSAPDLDLEAVTEEIDLESRRVLDPEGYAEELAELEEQAQEEAPESGEDGGEEPTD
ncbi:ABC transporter substrate-binding protein [Nocardioides sp. SYSU DS0663]|uniref:ABC transporter substrate-binding protein n=1 Tax=Nocardioides sp. SYSU DS0663 TaxID=3416445 RepID=UPI003F4CA2F8